MSNIAIIGGHGKVALQLARILTDGSHTVGSLIRNPTAARGHHGGRFHAGHR